MARQLTLSLIMNHLRKRKKEAVTSPRAVMTTSKRIRRARGERKSLRRKERRRLRSKSKGKHSRATFMVHLKCMMSLMTRQIR